MEDKKKNIIEEDDGRTIASMDGLEKRGLLSSWFGALDPNVRAEHGLGRDSGSPRKSGKKDDRKPYDRSPVSYRGGAAPFEASGGAPGPAGQPGQGAGSDVPLDPDDRKALIKYVIGYSLAIGAVFAVIFGIVIFLMWKFW
ncbi:MAG: hypothetical protein IIZ42_02540 [Eubacterium sp.]|nr:hypothetical protein [Eubacterium sp.]